MTVSMSDRLTIIVDLPQPTRDDPAAMRPAEPISVWVDGDHPESAYFAPGVPVVLSRQLVEVLLRRTDVRFRVTRDDNPDGAAWFRAQVEHIRRSELAIEWEILHGSSDLYGVAAYLRGER